VPLARYTWYKLGGPARFFAEPRDEVELAEVLAFCDDEIDVYPLGLGANLLVSDDGVDGCVVRLAGEHWERVEIDGTTLTVGGGVSMAKLVKRCEREGLSGMECMAGIPGTVGGGLRMNAGGKFGDLSKHLVSLDVMNGNGSRRTLLRHEAGFGYRTSRIDAAFITSATFSLQAASPSDVVAKTRQVWNYKKDTQPMGGRAGRSCGCAFKNPTGDSAGRLIEIAGLKGIRIGDAQVSDHHANFITAGPEARSKDVSDLIDLVRHRVEAVHGVRLHPEVRRWPDSAS
jgi:UDP-N-acetylmuramate dehydrogenase